MVDKDVNESDPRSNVHYLSSSENKAWKKKIQACMGFKPMTCVIPVYQILRGSLSFTPQNISNPLTPISDQDRISPYNINTISTR